MKKVIEKEEKIVVFYHDDYDGFGAAWAAWKKLKLQAMYVPLDNPIAFMQLKPYITKQCDVYFLDICPEKSVLEKVKRMAHGVVIIDHHISRKELICAQKQFIFDTQHSCAFLAWKYFCPHTKIPKIIKYIQDLDLWQWKLRGTEALFTALSWKFDFRYWSTLARILEVARLRTKYIRIGNVMVQYKKQIIDAVAKEAEEVRLGKVRAFAVNAPSIVHSEVGDALTRKIKGVHVGIPFRVMNRGTSVYISLLSDGTVDVSKIAKKYGGGGQKAAAGFIWPLRKPLPFQFLKK